MQAPLRAKPFPRVVLTLPPLKASRDDYHPDWLTYALSPDRPDPHAPKVTLQEIGHEIRRLRIKRGLNQRGAALLIRCSQTDISDAELGTLEESLARRIMGKLKYGEFK